MDIEGVGSETIKKLWDEGIVRSLPDLYRLTTEQLEALEGFAEISAARAIESIQRSMEQPFRRVLFGLNIPRSDGSSRAISRSHFGSAEALAGATLADLEEVEGIGPDRAALIAEWFADEENLALIEELRGLGVQMVGEKAERVVRRGRSPDSSTSSRERSRTSSARRRRPRSRRSAPRSRARCRARLRA